MAKTVKEMIRDAYKTARMLAVRGESLDADREAYGLDKLNEMLHSWDAEGIGIGHVDLTINDSIPYEDGHIGYIRDNLAVVLAGDNGNSLSQLTLKNAMDGKDSMLEYYEDPPDLAVDQAIHPYYNSGRYF